MKQCKEGTYATSPPVMKITGPMNDQLDILKLVARRFDGAGIPYMLTGSLALSYYAEPRFTRDRPSGPNPAH